MSLGREWISDHMYELEQSQKIFELIQARAEIESSKNIWTTKEGKKINISKMDESHILNCINMLKRNHSPFASLYIPMFQKELKKRYESAF